jgi:secreted Zn-dependent insulinase-like peptidase
MQPVFKWISFKRHYQTLYSDSNNFRFRFVSCLYLGHNQCPLVPKKNPNKKVITVSIYHSLYSGANDDLKVPRPNDLMDKSPKMVAFDCQREHAMPELVLHMERIRMRAWYLPNTKLKLTKAFTFIKFSIVDPSMDQHPGCKIDTPKMACINSLFAFLVRDRLTEHSYKAQLAGLFYKLWPTRTGLELEVRGSSGKQDLFLRQLLNVIYDLGNETFKEERFKQVHDLHVNGLQSGEANKLKMQAKNILAHILCPGNHLRHSRLEAMGQIEADQVKQYARIFLLNHSVECFFYGNLCLEGVNRMTNAAIEARRDFLQAFAKDLGICQDVHEAELHLEDWFRNDPVNQIVLLEKSIQTTAAANDAKTNLDHDQVLDEAVVNPIEEDNDNAGEEDDTKEPSEAEDNNNRIMEYSLSKMSNGSRHIVIVNNEIQSSSCVLYFFQYSSNRALESSKLELFFHLVQVQLISTMKHVVPLGYVVGCDIRKVNDSLGFRITVESQYPLMVVYRTIEEALEDLDDYLANMTLEDFDMSKNAVLSVKAESMTSLTDQAHALWREIQDETYDFDRHAKELVQLERLDLMDVRTFYRQWIHSKARERRSLVVSISPDPILNRLDPGPRIHHWTLDQVEQLRSDMGTPIRGLPVPLEWFNSIFECSENIYEPPLP